MADAINSIWGCNTSSLVGYSLVIFFSLVQISPIKINPWTWLFKTIGKMLNGEVIERVTTLECRVTSMQATEELREAERARTRILRFNDELINGVRHSREYFNDVMRDIDTYEGYCGDHPKYQNNRAREAIANIKRVFRSKERTNDFLMRRRR